MSTESRRMQIQILRDQGAQAFREGRSRFANPYASTHRSMKDAREWERGFNTASDQERERVAFRAGYNGTSLTIDERVAALEERIDALELRGRNP